MRNPIGVGPLLERAYVENVDAEPADPARGGARAAADGAAGAPRRHGRRVPARAVRRRPTSSTSRSSSLLDGAAPDTTRRTGSAADRNRHEPQIVIDPITRIEGHSKITIQLDDAGEVTDAQFHVTQFRGFERIVQGRPVHEMPSIMARICGICPVSHLIASAKACDEILAVEPPPTGRRPAPGDEPGPDRAVQRAQLLPPLVARPAVRLRRRPGQAQHHRRRAGRPAARPRRHRRAPLRPADHRMARRQADPSRLGRAGRRRRAARRGHARPDPRRVPEAIAAIERALAWYKASLRRLGGRGRLVRRLPVRIHGARRRDGNVDYYDGWLRVMDADGRLLADRHRPARLPGLPRRGRRAVVVPEVDLLEGARVSRRRLPGRAAGARHRGRPDGHAAGRRGARRVPRSASAGSRQLVPLPLRPADRHAPLPRSGSRSCCDGPDILEPARARRSPTSTATRGSASPRRRAARSSTTTGSTTTASSSGRTS